MSASGFLAGTRDVLFLFCPLKEDKETPAIMRRPFVAGNWKMYKTLKTARELMDELIPLLPKAAAMDVAICPPSPYLLPMQRAIDGTSIRLGAQNMWYDAEGAFTGEASPPMLLDCGCTYVILGHSERRHTIGKGEDDALINRKVHAALTAGLTPILCIGETLEERDAGKTESVLTVQLKGGLAGVPADKAATVVVAYEPVWAIGTGRNATPQQAQEAHKHCRKVLAEMYNDATAQAVRIQYGGSVKPGNALELMSQPDVDGALVGGASLKASDFSEIIKATVQAKKV
jgi:triosephosphate isomerase (TIM)